MSRVLQDIRYALRAARRSPLVAAVAIVTLALGIGVNTAMFSVLHAVLLTPPPYADPEALVLIRQKFPRMSALAFGASPGEFVDYRDRHRVFSSIAGYEDAVFDLTGTFEPVRVQAQRVTHTLFSTLGVAPLAGRVFTAEEDLPGAPGVAVISHAFWQHRWGGRHEAIGLAIRLNERPYTIVGIMPPRFEFPFGPANTGEPPALWVPMAFTETRLRNRASEFPVNIVARLRPGASRARAEDDVRRIVGEFEQERADLYSGNLVREVEVQPLGEPAAARVRPVLLTLAGAVVFVLLIACANVANLLLARAAAREREMAVRQALGASRTRLAAQPFTESLLLTGVAAAGGVALAQAIIVAIRAFWPTFVAGLASVRVDAAVLAFTAGVSIVTGALCGLAPALNLSRKSVHPALQQGGRSGSVQPRAGVRRLLVVVESSSAFVLLIGAGLLLHSFVEVLRVPPGFSPDGVLIARTTFNRERYPSAGPRYAAQRAMLERLQASAGVEAAGLTTHIPLADSRQIGFVLEGETIGAVRWADSAIVGGDYFRALGIPLLRGRTFEAEDRPDTPLTAIVNDAMARRFWPDGSAVGRRVLWGGRTLTIVGVVGDVHVTALDRDVSPTIYMSVFQIESGATAGAVFVVRAANGNAATLAPVLRETIQSVDSGIPVFDVRLMREVVAGSLETRRFALAMLSTVALLALTLAVIGLYGVLSYAVAQRTSELGVRLALGATPREVLQLVAGDGFRLTAAGVAIGAGTAALMARSLSHLLFGVSAYDPATYAGAAVLLLAVGCLASAVPAWRAARVDPLAALRAE